MDGRMAEWSKAQHGQGHQVQIQARTKNFSSFDECFYFQVVPLTPHLTPKCQNGKISF